MEARPCLIRAKLCATRACASGPQDAIHTKGHRVPGKIVPEGWVKLLLAVVLLAVGLALVWRFIREQIPIEEMAYYYDVSEQKLFAAPRRLVPPIRGLNDGAEDAFRAMVFSTTGKPKDKASRRIAYLEKFSPELKQQIEVIQKAEEENPAAPLPPKDKADRVAARAHRFVRRLTDSEWYPLDSPQAEKILIEWQTAESVVCVP